MVMVVSFVIVFVLIGVGALTIRAARSDPRTCPHPPRRYENDWSCDLPNHPYNHRLHT